MIQSAPFLPDLVSSQYVFTTILFSSFVTHQHIITPETYQEFNFLVDLDSKALELSKFLNKPTNYLEEPTSFRAVSGDKVFDNFHDYALHRLDVELTRRQKRRPDLTKEKIFELMNGLDSESIAYTLEEMALQDIPDKSNIFHYKGQDIDVTKLSKDEIFHYINTVDETYELMQLEHVRTIFHISTPNEMLHYPEPFIASPSFIHDDLHFLHIIHYQF